jgi:tRNA(Ile)-lysidine synthase
MTVPGITCIPEISAYMESTVIGSGEADIRGERFVKYFDFDKIKGNLYARSRREGDTKVPLGLKGRQKIKELFIDCKIPRDERDRIPIVSDNREILWAVGYKMSDIYRIDGNTKKILKLELRKQGGNSNA